MSPALRHAIYSPDSFRVVAYHGSLCLSWKHREHFSSTSIVSTRSQNASRKSTQTSPPFRSGFGRITVVNDRPTIGHFGGSFSQRTGSERGAKFRFFTLVGARSALIFEKYFNKKDVFRVGGREACSACCESKSTRRILLIPF